MAHKNAPILQFNRGCKEAHCFFYSQLSMDCIFAGNTVQGILSYLDLKNIPSELFLNNTNCDDDHRETLNEFKLNETLLAGVPE